VQYLLPLRDIAVFVFDKRGTGRSTGDYSIDITPLARDLVAAVDAVRSHGSSPGTIPRRLTRRRLRCSDNWSRKERQLT
jgi:pimeloyl-ACP methyl ester carboxylesterase